MNQINWHLPRKEKKLPPNFLYFGPAKSKDGVDNNTWRLKFKGQQGTHLEGGCYECTITLPPDFPKAPPKVHFINNFKHMHVYFGGEICLPIIHPSHWASELTIVQVGEAIYRMINAEPNPNDPANLDLKKMYLDNKQDYYKMLKEQAKAFSVYCTTN